MIQIILLLVLLFIVLNSMAEEISPPDFDLLWNYSDPASTDLEFQKIYDEFQNTASASYLTQLLSQQARTKGLQSKFQEGFTLIEKAESILPADDHLSKVRILLEKGRLFNSSGNRDNAMTLFLEAKDLAVAGGFDLFAIDAVHMLGIADIPENQIKWNLLAITMIEDTESKKAKNWLGPLLNNTGWSYFDLAEYEEAMELFVKSLQWREEIGDENGTRIAKWTIARTKRALKLYDEALEIQLALEKEIIDKGLEKDGYVYEELAELYLIIENTEKSKEYFGHAYMLLSEDQWLQKNEPERLARLKELSR